MMYGLTLPAYATLIDRGGGLIYERTLISLGCRMQIMPPHQELIQPAR
jgi:hypothetical protein